ncbi:MAG: 16S rRNA (cytosine(1402)-N(4))-methyltransferase RsmH [Jatrophihabitans sp.]|uniref:16S rRNA (cytosine(1402)-N(4))-methyltransferase RsmH n=1 Tax=Jatrophihabitans sp. TaxID=1932789 RepID=UPI003F7DB4DF
MTAPDDPRAVSPDPSPLVPPPVPTVTHVPVLLERVLALLAPALSDRPAVAVDATLGLGGHAEALLTAHPQLTLVGLDRDPAALDRSRARLARFATRVHLVHAVYDRMPEVLAELDLPAVDGVLFDLGVSSMQLDLADRGFAYAQDAPLDMRMDQSTGATAADVVNGYAVPDLARVLREYGEERFALRIAQAIDRRRRTSPLTSTAELAELVRDAIPAATRRHGGHPAKRTFQALRIEVNRELDALRTAVPAALDALRVGGRIAVLSYQSLEDRIVKQAFARLATDRTPVDLPVSLADRGPELRLLTRGSEPATDDEIAANPRAASVRLRAAERIAPARDLKESA